MTPPLMKPLYSKDKRFETGSSNGEMRTTLATLMIAITLLAGCARADAAPAAPPDYARDVAPILAKYCAGCHNAKDREGELNLESFAELQQGSASGEVVVAGEADASLLVLVLTGETEPAMPPEDNPRPSDAEIAVLRAWIAAGAKGPAGGASALPELVTPDVPAAASVRPFATSLAVSPDGKQLAIGRYRRVELVDPATGEVTATSDELPGKINALAYSSDGATLVAASGVTGLHGTATLFPANNLANGLPLRGHRDAIYDAQLSPDGRLLATSSYDRQINLWDVASGEQVRTLAGHNGAVFDVAFSPDGAALASASADGTVKLWNVATGERLDTLGQPESEQYAVAFSPDGQWIAAAGADRQIRLWRFVANDGPRTNPLIVSQFAHEEPVVKLAFSPDGSKLVSASEGGEISLWDARSLAQLHRYEEQPDVVSGLAFHPAGDAFFVTRLDGSWQRYAVEAGVAEDNRGVASVAAQPADRANVAEAPIVEATEQEPNDAPESATPAAAHALIHGVIGAADAKGAADVDLYRFPAKAGQQFVLEINAARQKSPLDSHIEVLDAAGNSIPQVLLQAVRESYFTFRGHNSTDSNDYRLHRWEDMELNEYLYAGGEVVKLWLYPRGPDSGFLVYPGAGPRYGYFGTTPITHALNEPCYIVEPHPPGTTLLPNGLPQYTVYYENDDDSLRRFGADSRLAFTAPADGAYLVRVQDVRGQGGDDYKYDLTIRAPKPDFNVTVQAPDLTVNAGSGKEFTVQAERLDEFDGPIRVEISGLPPGFHASTPIVIEAGQNSAAGVVTADADAPAPTPDNAKTAQVVAIAQVGGQETRKEVGKLGELKLAERPKILVQVLPNGGEENEVIVAPGETVSAIVRVERNGYDGEINFGSETAGRNLPHGVYIDNIGLNGMTLLAGESERTFYITAAKWVPETRRPFHLRTNVEGNQTSRPVTLHVRKLEASTTQTETASAP